MRRMLTLALLATLASGCGTTVAAAPSPPAASPSPSSTPTPTPTVDPTCASDDLRAFLDDIDDYTTRGAFEVKPKAKLAAEDVYRWRFDLISIEGAAELQLYKAAKSAQEAVAEWTRLDPGSLAQRITGMTIQVTAKTLAMECRVSEKYAFSRTE